LNVFGAAQLIAGIRVFESHIGVPARLAFEYTSVRGIGQAGTNDTSALVLFVTVTVVENLIGLFAVTCEVAV